MTVCQLWEQEGHAVTTPEPMPAGLQTRQPLQVRSPSRWAAGGAGACRCWRQAARRRRWQAGLRRGE